MASLTHSLQDSVGKEHDAAVGGAAGRRREACELDAVERRLLSVALNYPACGIHVAALAEDAGLTLEEAEPLIGDLADDGFLVDAAFADIDADGRRSWSAGRFVDIRDAGITPAPLPALTFQGHEGPIPAWLASSFWHHPDPKSITIPADAEYAAAHLLTSTACGLRQQGWALRQLPVTALENVLPQLDERMRLLVQHYVAQRLRGTAT